MILIIKDHLACNTIETIKEQVYMLIILIKLALLLALYYIAYKLKKFYTSRAKSVEIQENNNESTAPFLFRDSYVVSMSG
jgi:hypothetical protein